MKKALLTSIGVVGIGLGITACNLDDLCATEVTAHSAYIVVAPLFRPASAIAKELQRYNAVMALCAAGASYSKIKTAADQAAAARSAAQ